MKYTKSAPPLQCFMRQSTWYTSVGTVPVRGVLIHSTGANNPYISRYVQPDDDAPGRERLLKLLGKNKNGNDWNHSVRHAGVHAFVGRLASGEVSTVQVGEWNKKAWGCASGPKGSCNNGWIQFEICEDGLADPAYFNRVYQEAAELTAYLCAVYKLDPLGTVTYQGVRVPVILCHQDSYRLGLGSGHADVLHWFPKFGKSMDDFRADVARIMKGEDDDMLSYEDWKSYMDRYRKELGSAPAPNWAVPHIGACIDAGVLVNAGTEDDPKIDRPGDLITRQEAAVMAAMTLKAVK